jgi:uncharacterized membrane protein YkvA (DUF1232 family)
MSNRAPVAAATSTVGAVTGWQWLLIGLGVTLAVYAALVAGLALAGRRGDAGALATFMPDCLVLMRALLGDLRVPTRSKVMVVALLAYLAMPFDLVPDFIPIAGQLDDAIVLALVLRSLLRSGGPELVREHWRGPERSLAVILRLA